VRLLAEVRHTGRLAGFEGRRAGDVESETFSVSRRAGRGKNRPQGGSRVSCGSLVGKRMDSSLSDVYRLSDLFSVRGLDVFLH